jgi:hypothetical protein
MKRLLFGFLLVLALVSTAGLYAADGPMPRLSIVTPDSGKAGDEFTATGENVGKQLVKELYLTDGKDDTKVQIVTQKDDSIVFKVPAGAKAGRYSLMILSGDGKQFLEQPVKLTIE